MRTRLAAASAATALLLAAAGCGDEGTPGGDRTGSPSSAPPPDVGYASPSAGGSALPSGFPSDDVPLVDGDVVNVVQGGAGKKFDWSVVLRSERSVGELAQEAADRLKTAGYTAHDGPAAQDVSVRHYTGPAYDVAVTVARTGPAVTATYVVRKR